MKTLERKSDIQAKPKKMMGRFATIEDAANYKTSIANKMLAKVKNLDEFFTVDGIRKN